ncbi:MAG: hypothetical protein KatS3mg105_3762 [Gemmatales bacterium]|nr:MAG: hypothetical protein KatS3mg105_3762 [Gemmatales bacterium]
MRTFEIIRLHLTIFMGVSLVVSSLLGLRSLARRFRQKTHDLASFDAPRSMAHARRPATALPPGFAEDNLLRAFDR